jgi:hypothetical protein
MATKPNQEKPAGSTHADPAEKPQPEGDSSRAAVEGRTNVQQALDAWARSAVERALMNSLRIKLKELEGLMEQLRRRKL